MNIDRLSEFADYLEREVSDGDFTGNMEGSIRQTSMGHAADCFAFRGLTLVNMGTYDDLVYKEKFYGMTALMMFFDVDHQTFLRLFGGGSKVTRLDMIDRIREEL
jgi:hypothetical protein